MKILAISNRAPGATMDKVMALVKAGVSQWKMIPLGPFTRFSALFEKGQ